MTSDNKLTSSEIHELALIYAKTKFSDYIQNGGERGEYLKELRELNVLITFYKDAMTQMDSAEKAIFE